MKKFKNIAFSNEQISKIYEVSYSINQSRGKNRQNIINSVVIESLKQDETYDGCLFRTEVNIPKRKLLWGESFPVDICVYKDYKLIEIILNKAPASNIKQNKINTLNSINSDITRLSKLNDIKISLVNFLPRITPFFMRNETIKHFEKNSPFFLSTCGVVYKFEIDEIYVMFDIGDLNACKTKSDVKNLFSINPIKNIKICNPTKPPLPLSQLDENW